MNRCRALVVIAAASVLLMSCSDTLSSPKGAVSTVEQAGTFGTPVDFFGVTLSVVRVTVGDKSVDQFPRILISVRSTNTSSERLQNPNVQLFCDESERGGDWFDGSSWEPNGLLNSAAVLEGEIVMGFPPKTNASRYPVPSCTHPRIVASGSDPLHRRHAIRVTYTVPDQVITDAINAPRGEAGLPPVTTTTP